jgi:hypothetical protein
MWNLGVSLYLSVKKDYNIEYEGGCEIDAAGLLEGAHKQDDMPFGSLKGGEQIQNMI